MVYLESGQLGWRPLKDSFLESLPRTAFNQEQISSLDELFEWLVQPILVQIKKSDLFVPFSEQHLVTSMIRLLGELLCVDELVRWLSISFSGNRSDMLSNIILTEYIILQLTYLVIEAKNVFGVWALSFKINGLYLVGRLKTPCLLKSFIP